MGPGTQAGRGAQVSLAGQALPPAHTPSTTGQNPKPGHQVNENRPVRRGPAPEFALQGVAPAKNWWKGTGSASGEGSGDGAVDGSVLLNVSQKSSGSPRVRVAACRSIAARHFAV